MKHGLPNLKIKPNSLLYKAK